MYHAKTHHAERSFLFSCIEERANLENLYSSLDRMIDDIYDGNWDEAEISQEEATRFFSDAMNVIEKLMEFKSKECAERLSHLAYLEKQNNSSRANRQGG